MSFPDEIKTKVLLWSDRHCCLCKKPCGANIEVHHILPESDGGNNDIDNAIPLCFDCHGHVHHYSERHPVGNKYKSEELRARRNQVYDEFTRRLIPPIHYEITQVLPNGKFRGFPDVGFIVQHCGDCLPVRLTISVDMRVNGKSMGSPAGSHYSARAEWHLNPQSVVSGHFSFASVDPTATKIGAIVNVAIFDMYDRRHENLPVGWIYLVGGNSWYFEPCVSEFENDNS